MTSPARQKYPHSRAASAGPTLTAAPAAGLYTLPSLRR